MSVVAHSHWDREWYAPFEAYRLRLVTMMDGLLQLLEGDGEYAHFHLDGQVAMVDDYLDARPEARSRLRALIGAGRLSVGPWYVLMDEFCVSAETVVRNLQLGMERAAALGGGPTVGYLPDMFGHVGQMPQILSAAGISEAVVWRGVPSAVTSTAFWWEGPDGSRVRAEYLPVGYAAGAFLPADPDALVTRLAAHEEEIGAFLRPGWPLLLMNGGDHQNPQPWLPDVLKAANGAQDRYFFQQVSLEAHLAAAPTTGLPTWRGELRSGHRAPVLTGVLSNRVDIKRAAAATEEVLERRAEPLAALWLPPDLWPAELERAWLEVIRNSAHDSICACSADEVGRAVLHRYDTARALAADAVDRSVAIAGVALAGPGPAVLNPLPHLRSGLVELLLAGTEPPPGTQQLEAVPDGRHRLVGTGGDLAAMVGRLAGGGWLGPSGRAVAASLDTGPDGLELILDHDPTRSADRLLTSTMAEAWARAGAGRDQPLTVTVRRAGWQRVLARVADVPGWGWSEAAPDRSAPAVTVGDGPVLDNGLVRVEIDPATGTFSLDGVAGQNLIVEEGDAGDTYNFAPVPGAGPVTEPAEVMLEVLERGPLRGSVRVRRRYRWPAGLGDADRDPERPVTRSPRLETVEVVSDVELRAGETAVRVETSFDNRSRDHRVRVVFPLAGPAPGTTAECAFATVERAPGAEGGRLEPALATFPSRRFVTAGDLTVTHDGLLEYELAPDGRSLALTLLRATGVISRPWLPTRPNVAGPPLPVEDTQMPGRVRARYALASRCGDPFRLADEVWTPLIPFRSEGHGHLPRRGSRLEVDLGGCALSALHRRGGAVEMRVFNPSATAREVAVPGRTGTLVDLRDRPVGRWDGRFPVAPGAVVTARLDSLSLD